MTQDADFKKLIRARMAATGENYTTARAALVAVRPGASGTDRSADDPFYDRTVRAFFDGDRLVRIPAKRKARVVVLLELMCRFEAGREYAEREVSDLLAEAHEDFAWLRRELVDYGYLTRADGRYRVASAPPVRDPIIVQEMPSDEAARFARNLARSARAVQPESRKDS